MKDLLHYWRSKIKYEKENEIFDIESVQFFRTIFVYTEIKNKRNETSDIGTTVVIVDDEEEKEKEESNVRGRKKILKIDIIFVDKWYDIYACKYVLKKERKMR